MRDNLNTVDALMAHYASGLLPEPARVLVDAHLEITATNRPLVAGLDVLLGDCIEATVPEPIAARETRLQAIYAAPDLAEAAVHPVSTLSGDIVLPPALRSYLGMELADVPWKTKLPGFKEYTLGTIDGCEVNLFWIRAGRAVPKHTHGGCELTLVLDGAFNDGSGRYGRGDISVADDSIDHRPVAEKDRPCIGFAVVDAPLKLTGSLRQLLGDLIG